MSNHAQLFNFSFILFKFHSTQLSFILFFIHSFIHSFMYHYVENHNNTDNFDDDDDDDHTYAASVASPAEPNTDCRSTAPAIARSYPTADARPYAIAPTVAMHADQKQESQSTRPTIAKNHRVRKPDTCSRHRVNFAWHRRLKAPLLPPITSLHSRTSFRTSTAGFPSGPTTIHHHLLHGLPDTPITTMQQPPIIPSLRQQRMDKENAYYASWGKPN